MDRAQEVEAALARWIAAQDAEDAAARAWTKATGVRSQSRAARRRLDALNAAHDELIAAMAHARRVLAGEARPGVHAAGPYMHFTADAAEVGPDGFVVRLIDQSGNGRDLTAPPGKGPRLEKGGVSFDRRADERHETRTVLLPGSTGEKVWRDNFPLDPVCDACGARVDIIYYRCLCGQALLLCSAHYDIARVASRMHPVHAARVEALERRSTTGDDHG